MKAVTWHGTQDVRVDEHPDPTIEEPTDAIVRVTSTAICGSDLHLYDGKVIKLEEGDVIGASCSSRTCCPPPGRQWRTPTRRRAARWAFGASGRSARCA